MDVTPDTPEDSHANAGDEGARGGARGDERDFFALLLGQARRLLRLKRGKSSRSAEWARLRRLVNDADHMQVNDPRYQQTMQQIAAGVGVIEAERRGRP